MKKEDSFSKMEEEHIQLLKEIIGVDAVVENKDQLYDYASDHTEDFVYLPSVAVLPKNTEEVSAIAAFCYKNNFPLTVRGAGTGLSGGALPIYGGVLMSTEKLNKIIDIDEANLQATVEPGIITQVFQEAVLEKGLFYPPDPASKGSCFIGGNLAENSGGPKAVKYGVTKDYVLNLEVVLADGTILWTGADVLKNATGLNLTQLMVGSEGTLGIITKAVFRLIPAPTKDLLMLVPFRKAEEACVAVSKIFHLGITPSGLEFMEKEALDFTIKYIEGVELDIPNDIQAHLLIELDGNDMDVMMKEAEQIFELLQSFDCDEILIADSKAQKDKLWHIRRSISEAVKRNSVYKEEDTVVKRAYLADLLIGVKEIGNKYGFKSICYGHAGDGNLHVNIIKGDLSDEEWSGEHLKNGIREIFKLCKKLGGTISGEHGIGLVQKEYMDIMFTPYELELQKSIKDIFDPKGILNPGKIWL